MLKKQHQRAVCIGIRFPDISQNSFNYSMNELKELSETAGFIIIGEEFQNRSEPDVALFIGKGRLSDIADLYGNRADTLVFNHDLSPSQIRNVEKETGLRALTRTEVILGIFAIHAKSRAAKLQVEMANLVYQMPRIIGKGIEMSRIEGGIGMKGPGEQQLELDRRKIRYRISLIKKELEHVSRERDNQRKRRRDTSRKIAIVGYTNSGKSTLLNRLAKEKIETRNQLFVTLDTTTRKMWLGGSEYALITDTVGFIRDIPHGLIESFRSTFDDALESDILLHLIDASAPDVADKILVTGNTLHDMKKILPEMITVFNKTDCISMSDLERMKNIYKGAFFISAMNGDGIDELRTMIKEYFCANQIDGKKCLSI
jgi:GTPase